MAPEPGVYEHNASAFDFHRPPARLPTAHASEAAGEAGSVRVVEPTLKIFFEPIKRVEQLEISSSVSGDQQGDLTRTPT